MKNIKSAKKLGFSLLELSVVLVVIAAIIIGILKGSDLIYQAKLKTAGDLTVRSPVFDTDGLVLFYESTLDDSFLDDEIGEGKTISSWIDHSGIDPNNPNNATQSTETNKPTYREEGINGLPAIEFDGTDNYFTVDSARLANTSYTIFFVEQRTSSKSNNAMIGPAVSTSPTLLLRYSSDTALRQSHGSGNYHTYYSVDAYSAPIPKIIVFTFQPNTGTIYLDGTNVDNGTLTTVNFSDTTIGRYDSNYYQGYLGEIIFFNRVLSDKERKDIESYLSKKWGIGVSI